MRINLTILCAFLSFLTLEIFAQSPQYNNFDTQRTLEILIDSTSADTIWQIGTPQKLILNETSSMPNALITDTLNTYLTSTEASFVVEMSEYSMQSFPYIQLEWFQKIDFEDGVDGGIIEVSYDGQQTWRNIFSDILYRPEVVGTYQWDTLHNQQAGVTGTSALSWMGICWGTAIGNPPDEIESVHVRFKMTTDSIDTQQDGWLMDDFYVGLGVIGNTSNQANFSKMSIYPNPTANEIAISVEEVIDEVVDVYVYDNTGRMVYTEKAPLFGEVTHRIDMSTLQQGMYYLLMKGEKVQYREKFIKLE